MNKDVASKQSEEFGMDCDLRRGKVQEYVGWGVEEVAGGDNSEGLPK